MNAIRKNSFVTNNQPVKPNYSWQKEIPAGTEFIVSKRAKDGTLYLHATNSSVSYTRNTLLHESQVTKITKNYTMPKVGDLFYSSWGYDQTNIDFYQVTNVLGKKMVEVTRIAGNRKYDLHMAGVTFPQPNHFLGNPRRVMIRFDGNERPYFKVASYAHAWPTTADKSHFFSEWH